MRPDYYLRLLRLRLGGVVCSFDGVRVDRRSRVEHGARLAHHVELLDSRIGRFTSLGRYAKCHYADLGPFCSVAWDVTIGATGHPMDRVSTHAFAYRREIGGFTATSENIERPRAVVGADVWVGAQAIVMPGVHVAIGAVLGAGSIVTRDIPPYAVVSGSPARVMRLRIPEDCVPSLLRSRWWEWPDTALRQHTQLFAKPVTRDVAAQFEAVAQQLGLLA